MHPRVPNFFFQAEDVIRERNVTGVQTCALPIKKKKMKKKADWLTKAKKRKAKKKDRGIVDVMMLTHHFFKELPVWLNEMTDPRNPSYTIYSQDRKSVV